jgi:DnaJ-class molecular chaperone
VLFPIQAIGNAFAVLSNPEKRQRYDQYGSEEEQLPEVTRRHYYNGGYYEYDFTRGFEGMILQVFIDTCKDSIESLLIPKFVYVGFLS